MEYLGSTAPFLSYNGSLSYNSIRAIVTEEDSCAPEIFYIDFQVFIWFYLKVEIFWVFIAGFL